MSVSVTMITELVDDHYLLTFRVDPSKSTIPASVFIYTNTGDGVLGVYQSVCSLDELTRLKPFIAGTPTPVFGNKYLRHNEAKITVSLSSDIPSIEANITTALKDLATSYGLARSSTKVITIV